MTSIVGRAPDTERVTAFWSPVQELHHMPGGWKGRRNDGLEVLIFKEGRTYTAFVRVGTSAALIGDRSSLSDAAWLWWKWGRTDLWP